jgi:hypothetical protein
VSELALSVQHAGPVRVPEPLQGLRIKAGLLLLLLLAPALCSRGLLGKETCELVLKGGNDSILLPDLVPEGLVLLANRFLDVREEGGRGSWDHV